MDKELMWACAIIPQELNHRIVTVCKTVNRDINLPENVFRFPLHSIIQVFDSYILQ